MSDESTSQVKLEASSLVADALRVITGPTAFFREMPRSGGFVPPLIFAVALGVVSGLLRAAMGLVGGGSTLLLAIGAVFLVPIFVAIFSFVGAAVAHIIWKVMGSKESYEASYRCGAYAAAILPLIQLVDWVPYVGVALGIAWYTYLMILASIQVHGIQEKTAKLGFGLVGGALVVMVLGMEFGSRKLRSGLTRAWAKEGVSEDDIEEARDALDALFSRTRK